MHSDRKKKMLLEQIRKTGIVQAACTKTNIARGTYYRWIREDLDFKMASEQALIEGAEIHGDIAENTVVKAASNGDVNAAKFILMHRRKPYRKRLIVDIQNTAGISPERVEAIGRAVKMWKQPTSLPPFIESDEKKDAEECPSTSDK